MPAAVVLLFIVRRAVSDTTQVMNVNGAALHVFERGDGDPVVLVHGSSSDYRTWGAQLDDLAADFRTFAYSRRYHWPNEGIPEHADYSMPEHVDDLMVLLRALGIGRAHLVGHSYGAFVALLAALEDPGLVRTLVLAEPPAITLFVSNSPTPAEILKLLPRRPRTALAILRFGATGVAPAQKAALRGDGDEAVRLIGRAILGPRAYDRLSESRLEQARVNYFKQELLGSGFADLDDEELRGLDLPVLLVEGRDSPALFHRLLDRLEELLPRTRRVEIPNASHLMHEDNPQAYNAALRSFLASHSGA